MKKTPFEAMVFIGRFQPFHRAHAHTLRMALSLARRVYLILGSSFALPSLKNPWNYSERMRMISACIPSKKIIFKPITDRVYQEDRWVQDVWQAVYAHEHLSAKIGIIGLKKDASSYYFDFFPQWEHVPIENIDNMNATDFRRQYFSKERVNYNIIPERIRPFLAAFKRTAQYQYLCSQKQNIPPSCVYLQQCGSYILLKQSVEKGVGSVFALPSYKTKNVTLVGAMKECILGQTQIFHEKIPIQPQEAQKGFVWKSKEEMFLDRAQFYGDHYQIIDALVGPSFSEIATAQRMR